MAGQPPVACESRHRGSLHAWCVSLLWLAIADTCNHSKSGCMPPRAGAAASAAGRRPCDPPFNISTYRCVLWTTSPSQFWFRAPWIRRMRTSPANVGLRMHSFRAIRPLVIPMSRFAMVAALLAMASRCSDAADCGVPVEKDGSVTWLCEGQGGTWEAPGSAEAGSLGGRLRGGARERCEVGSGGSFEASLRNWRAGLGFWRIVALCGCCAALAPHRYCIGVVPTVY